MHRRSTNAETHLRIFVVSTVCGACCEAQSFMRQKASCWYICNVSPIAACGKNSIEETGVSTVLDSKRVRSSLHCSCWHRDQPAWAGAPLLSRHAQGRAIGLSKASNASGSANRRPLAKRTLCTQQAGKQRVPSVERSQRSHGHTQRS
jgi:hypothetical protein